MNNTSESNHEIAAATEQNTAPVRYKAVYSVTELADRWQVHPESIRRLIRERKLKTLTGFRPYRITFDEVRRYETFSEADELRETYLNNRRRRT